MAAKESPFQPILSCDYQYARTVNRSCECRIYFIQTRHILGVRWGWSNDLSWFRVLRSIYSSNCPTRLSTRTVFCHVLSTDGTVSNGVDLPGGKSECRTSRSSEQRYSPGDGDCTCKNMNDIENEVFLVFLKNNIYFFFLSFSVLFPQIGLDSKSSRWTRTSRKTSPLRKHS